MKTIATESILFRSPSPQDVYCYTPSICRGAAGRLLASFDLGGAGVSKLEGPRSDSGDFGLPNQLRIHISDDHGVTWRETARLPMMHTRLFQAGDRLYALGQNGRLLISASNDNGETWSVPAVLETEGCYEPGVAIDFHNGKLYLEMERKREFDTWPGVAQVLLSADENADLTRPENWTFSEPFFLPEHIAMIQPFGMPLYPEGDTAPGRYNGRCDCLETNVLRIHDPNHLLYDPEDRTLVLLSRLHAGGVANMAVMLRGFEYPDGRLEIGMFSTPGGAPYLFVPLPGGQMKFHIEYDPSSRLYWMVSSQTTDSMTRPELLPPERYNLPDNERHRLVLHFSRNLIDWCFAGVIAIGSSPKESRHYAGMVIDGDDLLVLSRSGDAQAYSAHNGDLITLHRICGFRKLSY